MSENRSPPPTAEGLDQPVTVLGFRIPPNAENWRTRRIVADVLVGDMRIGLTVQPARKSVSIRPPTACDGQVGVELPGHLNERVTVAISLALLEREELVGFLSGEARPA